MILLRQQFQRLFKLRVFLFLKIFVRKFHLNIGRYALFGNGYAFGREPLGYSQLQRRPVAQRLQFLH